MAPVRSIAAAAALVAATVFVGGCGKQPAAVKPLQLTVWGVAESSGSMAPLISSVTSKHPNVRIKYEQQDADTYAADLVAALAAGRGPDIFAFPAGELRRWQELLQPAPQRYSLPVLQSKRTLLSKQQVVVAKAYDSLTPRQVSERFVRTVANDSVAGGKLYGLPVAVDTLALAYNQALLDGSRVARPHRYG
jgi:ABC-type glycerol-3-phosphate transport system substrate-binding protein